MTDLPKYSWLTSAKIEFLRGGMYDGALGLALTFSGRNIPAPEAADCLSRLLALSPDLPRDRLARISGSLPTTDPNFHIFVQAMTKYKFHVMALVTPDCIGSWLDSVPWVTLRTTTPMLMFQPNEVWYSPEGDEWQDLTMPMVPNKITFMYFDRTKNVDATQKFFCESQFHWQLM